jgi:hypothetical protein
MSQATLLGEERMQLATAKKPVVKVEKKQSAEESIFSFVQQAYEQADGNFDKATNLIEEWLDENPTLREEIAQSLVRQAIRDHIQRFASGIRTTFYVKRPPGKDNTRGLERLAEQALKKWYDLPLPGGKKLGDAMKDEVKAAADYHLDLGRTHNSRGKFLSALAGSIPEGKKVRDVITEKKIEEIASSAE